MVIVIAMKTSMSRSRWIIAAILVGAAAMPAAASPTTAEDPGAFAALGSVYFRSILEQAGIGSGGSGESTGSPSGAAGQNMMAGSGGVRAGAGNDAGASLPAGAGSDKESSGPSDPQPGDVASGGDPQAGTPGGPYAEVFKDPPPPATVPGGGLDPAKDNGSTNPPSDDPAGTPWPTGNLPDDILGDQGGLTLPPVAAIAPTASIVQIPEPASLAMFGAGLLLVGLITRRRV